MLEEIKQGVSNVESETSSISSNTHDVYDLNSKLDRIIELLEIIVDK